MSRFSVEGESLLLALSDLAVSSGSACATLRGEPSYVLRRSAAASSLRSSLRTATRPRTTSSERRCASEPRSSGCGRSRRQCWLRQADARRPALWGPGAARFRELPGAGEVTGDEDVIRARVDAADDGARVVLSLRTARGVVVEARFRAYGCPYFIAAASWLTERPLGASRHEVAEWDWRDALEIPPSRFGRLITLQDAARAAAAAWPGATATRCRIGHRFPQPSPETWPYHSLLPLANGLSFSAPGATASGCAWPSRRPGVPASPMSSTTPMTSPTTTLYSSRAG